MSNLDDFFSEWFSGERDFWTGAKKKQPETQMPVAPTTPTAADAAKQATAKVTQKKRAIARSKSVYTSPLGIGTQADTAKKTLLGQ